MTKRLLGKVELEDIILGSTLLASGGGGSPHDALNFLIKEIRNKVTLLDPGDSPDETTGICVAGLGAPSALREQGLRAEPIYAYEAMKNIMAVNKVNLDCLVPAEIGPVNIAIAFYVASQKNIPVVDADGCGRSVPELNTTLFAIYKIASSPFVITNKAGDTIVVHLADPLNIAMADTIARAASVSFGMVAGLAIWPVNMATIKKFLVLNSLSKVEQVGKAIREARETGKDPVKEATVVAGGKELFRGKIEKIQMKTAESWDFGRTTIKGMDNYKGKTFMIDFRNENMIAWQEGKPIIMAPDLITMMTTEGEPVTNADTKEGMEIAVIGIKAPEPWMRTPEGFNSFKHILVKLGYNDAYISRF